MPQFYLLPDLPGMDVKDKLIQLTAELAVHTGNLEDPETAAKNLYDRLIVFLPPPPPYSVLEDGLNLVNHHDFRKVGLTSLLFYAHFFVDRSRV